MSHAIAIRQPYLLIKPLNLKWRFNLRIFIITTSILVLPLLVFYIFQVNKLTSDRYLLRDQESTVNKLSQENKILGINSNQANSLDNIDSFAKELGFEKVSKAHYIKVLEGLMAAK